MENLRDFLKSEGLGLGFQLTDNQIERFFIYLSEIKRWNKRINLTAIRDDKLIIIRLFLESLTFAYGFNQKEAKNILDIGTGAGIPGIPLKILYPEISFTLVDSSRKKVVFLKHICRQINLTDIECIAERVEDIAERYEGHYDVILSKGVAEIDILLKSSFQLLKSKGLFITQKGEDLEAKLKGSDAEFKKGNWSIKEIIEIDKPIFDRKFRLAVIQKCFT
jgi:16S rRNA (guanine527-N7)-methyltransferase